MFLAVALSLLAASLVPTRFAVQAGLQPARAATMKTALAIAGLSTVCGYIIALVMSRSS